MFCEILTIAPVSLSKFKNFQIRRHLLQRSNRSLAKSNLQQNYLESDIREVSLSICELNLEHNASNKKLDKDISEMQNFMQKEGINGGKNQAKFVYDWQVLRWNSSRQRSCWWMVVLNMFLNKVWSRKLWKKWFLFGFRGRDGGGSRWYLGFLEKVDSTLTSK